MNSNLLVMVVEDEPFLLIGYECALEDAGCRFISASNLRDGLDCVTNEIDVAILDIRLGEDRVFPLAYRLAESRIPFVFCSGTAEDMPEGMFSDVRLLHKPVSAAIVVQAAIEVANRQ